MSRLDIKTPSKAQMVVEHLYRSMEHRIEASPPGLCPIDMALNFLNLCHAQAWDSCRTCSTRSCTDVRPWTSSS